MNFGSLLLLAAVFGLIQGVRWEDGACPDFEQLPRFLPGENLMLRYLYERKSFNNFLFDFDGGKCTNLYAEAEHGVVVAMYQQIDSTGKQRLVLATADMVNDPNFMKTNIFNVTFSGWRMETIINAPVMLIATDQSNYAVTYSCRQITSPDSKNTKKLESAWAYTVVQGDSSYDEQIKRDLDALGLGLDYDRFEEIDQNDCPAKH